MNSAVQKSKQIVINIGQDEPESLDPRDIAARVAFNYNYTLEEAMKLSARDSMLLLRTVDKEMSIRYYNMTVASVAPHSKEGEANRILKDYRKRAK